MVPAIIHDIASSVRSPEYANELAKKAGAEVGFSATELLGCPRQYRLKKQHPYWEKPSGMYRMTFGSGYHAALSTYTGGITEQTLTWKFKLLGKSVLLVGTQLHRADRTVGISPTTRSPAIHPLDGKFRFCNHCDLEMYKGDDGLTCPNCGPLNAHSCHITGISTSTGTLFTCRASQSVCFADREECCLAGREAQLVWRSAREILRRPDRISFAERCRAL